LSAQGKTNHEAKDPMYSKEAPRSRRIVGSAHHKKPIGAPSHKYRPAKNSPRRVPSFCVLITDCRF
jgi:hypothetical protein